MLRLNSLARVFVWLWLISGPLCSLLRAADEASTHLVGGKALRVPLKSYDDELFYAEVQVGYPSQKLDLLLNIHSGESWIYEPRSNGTQSHRSGFNSSQSSSFKQQRIRVSYNYNNLLARGNLAQDRWIIEGKLIKSQQFAHVTEMFRGNLNQYDGIFGLGWLARDNFAHETPLSNLVKRRLIAKPVCSLYLNQNQSLAILGDIDDKLYTGEIKYFSIHKPDGDFRGWQLKLDRIGLDWTDVDAQIETPYELSGPNWVVFDSTTPFIVGCITYMHKFNVQYLRAKVIGNSVYMLPDCRLDNKPDFVFVTGGQEFRIKPKDYIIQIEREGEIICISAMKQHRGVHDLLVLGTSFLKNHYLVMDQAAERIGIAQSKRS